MHIIPDDRSHTWCSFLAVTANLWANVEDAIDWLDIHHRVSEAANLAGFTLLGYLKRRCSIAISARTNRELTSIV